MKRMLAMGALALAGCTASAADVPESAPNRPSAATRWIAAEGAGELSAFDAPARVLAEPNSQAVITAPVALRVLRIRVRPGQRVAQHEPLVDVTSPEIVRAAGELVSASLRADAFEARRARLSPLVEQGLSRSAELTELEAALTLARAEREGARATLRAAGLSDRTAQALLEGDGSFSLRSPLSGMVTRVEARPGEARDGSGAPLVEISGDTRVQIEARFVAAPPTGATLSWEGQGLRTALVLDAIASRAQPEDGTRLAWLSPAEGANAPLAGTLGRVRLEAAPDWVTVPSGAITLEGGKSHVRIRSGQRVEDRTVQVIVQTRSTAVVTGIERGTLVAQAAGTTP